MEQGKIMEAEVPTVRVGATLTGLTAPPPPQPPEGFFTGRMPFLTPKQIKLLLLLNNPSQQGLCLQCFDAVGWVAGRASGL